MKAAKAKLKFPNMWSLTLLMSGIEFFSHWWEEGDIIFTLCAARAAVFRKESPVEVMARSTNKEVS